MADVQYSKQLVFLFIAQSSTLCRNKLSSQWRSTCIDKSKELEHSILILYAVLVSENECFQLKYGVCCNHLHYNCTYLAYGTFYGGMERSDFLGSGLDQV